MKSKLIILSAVVFIFCASQVFAHGGEKHDESKGSTMEDSEAALEEEKGSMHKDELSPDAVNVGNAICPVSGELIAGVGDGKGVQIQHTGKIYNVCCKFCAKDFKKEPEKFITIIENNLAEGKDPGKDYDSDHDDEAEHHEGSHEKSDQGEPEHDEGISQKDEGHHDGGHGNHDH